MHLIRNVICIKLVLRIEKKIDTEKKFIMKSFNVYFVLKTSERLD